MSRDARQESAAPSALGTEVGEGAGRDRALTLARLPSHVGTLLPMRWVTLAEVEAEPGYVRHGVVASAQGMPLPVLVNGASDVETATR